MGAAAAAGDTGEGAAQELAELEGVKLDDDMAGGAADQVVVASGGTKMEEVSATGSTVTMVSTEVLAAMLKQQLGPVTAVLQGMRGEMTAVKTAINENQAKITEVGEKVGRLETDLGATAARVLELEQKFAGMRMSGGGSEDGWSESGSMISMMSQISALEAELAKMRRGHGQGVVAVIGGLTGYDGEAWKAWLATRLGDQSGEKHVGMFWKGTWAGMMWVKYGTADARDKAVKVVRDMGMAGVWAAPDRPLEDRVVGSHLLGLKKLLVDWGVCDRRDVRVDMEVSPMTIKMKGEGNDWTLVATARVQDGAVAMQWMEKWWGEWAELQADEGYKKLATTAKDKLAKSAGGMAKGSGKSTGKGKGKGGKKRGW